MFSVLCPEPNISPCMRTAELLALRWRRRLTTHLHSRYCQQHAFYSLQQRRIEQQQEQQEQREQQGLDHSGMGAAAYTAAGTTEPSPPSAAAAAVDNPDQRIASDAAALCDCLADLARVVAAAPFKILYYRSVGGWWGARRGRGLNGSTEAHVHNFSCCLSLLGLGANWCCPCDLQLADAGLPGLAGRAGRLRVLLRGGGAAAVGGREGGWLARR